MALVADVRPFLAGNMWSHVLKLEAERMLKPGESFREGAAVRGKNYCPEMVVVPAGSLMMGSPPGEKGRIEAERPQHRVMFASPSAVAKFVLTFDEWDACVA